MRKKQLAINLAANIVSFAVSAGIGFFLTPFIITALGREAYGFIALGINITNYGQILIVAFNAMAARFIALKIHEKDELGAKQYFSSVLIANSLLTVILLVPAAILLIFLQSIFDISQSLVQDVRLLWALQFITFIIGVFASVFGSATFVRNRLDLSARRDIIAQSLRALIIFSLFTLLPSKLWYVGIAYAVSSLSVIVTNYTYTKRLTPELRFEKRYFSIQAIKDLLYSGIWSSISMLSEQLLSGLDLLIANVFIGGEAMGVLAIAKVIPQVYTNFISQVQTVFIPDNTKLYAEKKTDEIVKNISTGMKIISFISIAPLCVFMVYGMSFYTLWVPTENARVLQILSVLTVGTMLISSTGKPLYGLFIIANRVKWNSMMLLIQGIISTTVVFILLSVLPPAIQNDISNPWGLYVIAGVSSLLGVIRALVFLPPFAARCLEKSKSIFYKPFIRAIPNIIIQSIVCYGIYKILPSDTWISLLLSICIVCVIVWSLSLFILFSQSERKTLVNMVKKRIHSEMGS